MLPTQNVRSGHALKFLNLFISQLMGTCHYRDYDFMSQNGQLYRMCEYVGWQVGNSKVGFVVLIINRS